MPPAARRTLLALAVVLALILAGLPPLLGSVAERGYLESLRQSAAAMPPGWVITEHYERGWFDSHASAVLTPPPTSTARGQVQLESRIAQGPWSWFGPGPWPALTRIHTRADWVDGDLALPPLLVDTVIGVGGTGETRLSVPATDPPPGADGRRLSNAELTGRLRFRADTRAVLVDLEVPRLALSDATGPRLGLHGARLTGQLTDWTAGRYAGQATLTVDAAEAGTPAQGGGESPTQIAGLRLTLEQSAAGPAAAEVDTRLDLRLDATAERLRLGGVENRSAVVGLTARSLDIRALGELAEAIGTLASEQVPPAMRGLAGLGIATQILPRLLAPEPRLVLDPVSLVTPEGPASARLTLAANGQAAAANGAGALLGALLSRGRAGFLNGIEGDASLDLPEPLARAWLAAAGGPDPLSGWVTDGWVNLRDGRLTSAMRLADGQLSINGRPLVLRLPGLGR